MVGRTKPQKNMEPLTFGDSNLAELRFLKEKNSNLAKALSDSKITCNQIAAERDMLQQELFSLQMRFTRLINFVKDMDISARACMNSIVTSSNYITNILHLTNTATVKIINNTTRSPFSNNNIETSPSTNRTHAVKPMIDGHVIFNPRINLRRVNENDIMQIETGIRRPSLNNSSDNSQNNANSSNPRRNSRSLLEPQSSPQYTDNQQELNNDYVDDDDSVESEDSLEMNNGLDTVQEEQEDDLEQTRRSSLSRQNSLSNTPNTSQVPLLSGIFRDVRVYLSPISNAGQCSDHHEHVNTERGSGKTKMLSRRSSSLYVAKTSEKWAKRPSLRNVPSESRRNTNNDENTSTSDNETMGNSFNSELQSSLLSSTRVGSPLSSQTPLKSALPSWINVLKGHRSLNKTNDVSEDLNESELNCLKAKAMEKAGRRYSSLLNNGATNRSSSINTDYDPLEGPSTLLDSSNITEESQSSFMKDIGLVHRSIVSSLTPPARGRTRKQRLSSEKRKSVEKKKSVVSTKVKVMLTKMSNSNNTSTGSSRSSFERRSGSKDKSSPNDLKVKRKRKNDSGGSSNKLSSPKVSKALNNENSPIAKKHSKKSKSSEKNVTRKRSELSDQPVRKKKKISNETPSPRKSSQSPNSPSKGGRRPRRVLQQISCKEPSLRKKLRRSR